MITPYQITGETIKSPIALKIREHFKQVDGEVITYPSIYKEQTVKDFDKPSFFIWTMDVNWDKVGKNRYEGLYQMNVRFHPEDEDENKYETLCRIGTELCDCLETINVPISTDGENEIILPVRGTDMEYKILDDILQFYVNYTLKAKRPITEIKMETLTTNTTTK